MKNISKAICLTLSVFSVSWMAQADVAMPSVFSDNMVLQQNSRVNVWGKANPGEAVSVVSSWSNQSVKTTADQDGKWRVEMQTPAAGNGHSLQIKATNTIDIKNILIGEVWLCSGQSNMDFQIAKEKGWRTGVIGEKEILKDADYPSIRLFHVKQTLSPVFEQDDCEGKWVVCDSIQIKNFSAIAFLFGRRLANELNVPVGLIQSTWGGTHAESWTKRSVIDADPVYKPLIEEQAKAWRDYASNTEKYEKAKAANSEKLPAKPKDPNNNKTISSLWNGMLQPLVPYTIKGVIWYQGESNSIRHEAYTRVFSNMIQSWREQFDNPQLPFYFVQIAPHYKQPAEIREAQLQTWKQVPYTGMAVITDVGDSTDIHPRNKLVPAERLAQWALAKDYGCEVAYSGPLYREMEVRKDKAVLSFDYLFGGLSVQGKTLVGFEIAGDDNVFYPAKAIIRNDQVVVSAKEVRQPVHVRYGWGKFFRANLCNGAGLPASPFKTY